MKWSFSILAALVCVGASAYDFNPNVSPAVKQQIIDDLGFMKTIQGSEVSPLHREIFGAVDGNGYVAFFEKRVTDIGMNSCGGGNAVACVIPFLGSSKIWLTKNYTDFQHPQIAKMMVVFHESRHTETDHGNWPHATCPTPFLSAEGKDMKSIWTGATLAGEPACDETPYGSYGSSLILLKNVSKFCTTCTEKVKLDAGIYADDQFGRIVSDEAKTAIKNDLYTSN